MYCSTRSCVVVFKIGGLDVYTYVGGYTDIDLDIYGGWRMSMGKDRDTLDDMICNHNAFNKRPEFFEKHIACNAYRHSEEFGDDDWYEDMLEDTLENAE